MSTTALDSPSRCRQDGFELHHADFMTRLRPTLASLAAPHCLVFVALCACSGGQTGDGDPVDQRIGGDATSESAPDPNSNGQPPSPDTPDMGPGASTPLCSYRGQARTDWEQELPLGFSAQDIVQWATIPSAVSASFRSTAELSIGPEVGPSELRFVFSPVGDSFYLTASDSAQCPPSVDIDGLLALESSRGAIDEVVPVTLHAWDAARATFEYTQPASRLRGSLQVLATKPEGGALQSLRGRGQMTPQGACGSLSAVLAFASLPPARGSGFAADPIAEGVIVQWPVGSSCPSVQP